ncbi:MAG: hypothetical protein ACXABY_02285 [Candidatus Thorarchaeota archaeon]
MSGPFRENWKRLSNKYPPNTSASAMQDKDIVRIEDVSTIFAASGVVTVSGVTPSNGDLLVGIDGGWSILPSGDEGEILKIFAGSVAWGLDASGIVGTFVVGPSSATDSAIALYDGTTGQLIKNSSVTIDASGNIFTSGNLIIQSTTVSTAPTTTLNNSIFFVAVSGAGAPQTINLPPAPADGQRHIIKDSLGVALTGSITVDGNGFNIDNASSVALVSNYEAMSLIFSSTLGRWQLI